MLIDEVRSDPEGKEKKRKEKKKHIFSECVSGMKGLLCSFFFCLAKLKEFVCLSG